MNFFAIGSWQRLMIAPKGASMKKHGPYTFKPPQDPIVMIKTSNIGEMYGIMMVNDG